MGWIYLLSALNVEEMEYDGLIQTKGSTQADVWKQRVSYLSGGAGDANTHRRL